MISHLRLQVKFTLSRSLSQFCLDDETGVGKFLYDEAITVIIPPNGFFLRSSTSHQYQAVEILSFGLIHRILACII